MIKLRLPIPPSINHYWKRNSMGGMRISDHGIRFRNNVLAEVYSTIGKPKPIGGRVSVEVSLSFENNRRRDLDNVCKALLDGLEHAGIYRNDSQIDYLYLERLEPSKPSYCDVIIKEVPER